MAVYNSTASLSGTCLHYYAYINYIVKMYLIFLDQRSKLPKYKICPNELKNPFLHFLYYNKSHYTVKYCVIMFKQLNLA